MEWRWSWGIRLFSAEDSKKCSDETSTCWRLCLLKSFEPIFWFLSLPCWIRNTCPTPSNLISLTETNDNTRVRATSDWIATDSRILDLRFALDALRTYLPPKATFSDTSHKFPLANLRLQSSPPISVGSSTYRTTYRYRSPEPLPRSSRVVGRYDWTLWETCSLARLIHSGRDPLGRNQPETNSLFLLLSLLSLEVLVHGVTVTIIIIFNLIQFCHKAFFSMGAVKSDGVWCDRNAN